MYLKGLELQGFKSFPDRIRLDFNKGITAVVGPNGSGKSNISDAVRWVLGEKSAKSLRGAKMEDIIFSGTADRKPMGFAEVSLIMDNSDHVLNVDFAEVSVTRKVYRTGDSEYLINGRACRQRDILELFMDTGVGKEGYSIIGQGRIDEILSSKSEDRRMLFEEAAGIVKYKSRCSETQTNLEHTQANLVRVNDIISELETQIEPLAKQAEKTKRYRVLYEELKGIQISIFVEDADRYEADIEQFEGQIAQLKGDIDNSRTEQNRLEENKEKFRERLLEINTEFDNITRQLTDKRAEVEKRNGDMRLCDNDVEHINDRIVLTKRDIELNNDMVEQNNEKIVQLNAQLSSKGIELTNKTAIYEKRRSEMQEISLRLSEGEEQLSRYNDEMFEYLNRRNELQARVSELSAVLKQYEENNKNSNEILSGYDSRLEQTRVALAVQKQEAEGVELEGKTIAENMTSLNAENDRIKVIREDRTAKQQSVLKEINEKNSRLRVLTEFKNDYEGYYGGVKAILKMRDKKGFEGIRGAVGEVITMPAELETAIEIALGGAVQNIIADTEENVKAAITYLKQNRLGRATFLPMNAVKGRTIGSERYKIINSKGVVGIAKELVQYSSEYEEIMSSLLDRVIIVDNIDNGILLARQTKYAYKIVTLEGDLFNAGGSMTGGSNNKKATGIFSRTREINDLQFALTSLQKDREDLNDELAKIKSRAEDISESLTEARDELQKLAVAKHEYDIKIEHINGEITSLENEKSEHITRMQQLSLNLERTRNDAAASEEQLKTLNNAIEEIKGKVDDYNDLLKSDKESRDLGNEAIILMSGELNKIKGEYDSIKADIERTKSDTISLSDKNKQLEASVTADLSLIEEKESEKARLSDETKRIESECGVMLEKQGILSEEKRKNTSLSDEYERRIRSIMQSISGLENEHTRIVGKKEQTEQRSRELYDRMFETYEITYVGAKSYPPIELKYDAKKREEARLKGEIRQLGSVNVNAVEEYDALRERYERYTNQQADIIDTEKKLKEIIEQLTTLMEVQFREQFKIISMNFSKVFAEMFGGGKATLKLADDNDVLNCGIDIEAQPPGKALQNMMLLSGGEKAMTAISLLFSILEMKPSPFCILDEIEAALDDANVVRFAEYLRNFTDTTQFIVITHRPGTREVADMLYGVTQERGISKLFSTNLEEIMKERESSGNI
jgi:chromosome segregation protein